MKKTGIRILSIMMMAAMLLSLAACNGTLIGVGGETESDTAAQAPSGNRQNTENYIYNVTEQMVTRPYQIEAASNVALAGVPVTDGEYNYFYFKLGETKNVPVYYEDAYYHDGRTVSTYAWSESTVTEDTYTEAMENSVSNSTNASVKAEVNTSASAGIKASYGALSGDFGVKVSTSLSTSLSHTHTESDKTTFTKKVSDKVQNSRTREVKIDKDSEVGYYRYVVYADFEVYAVLVCDIADKTVQYTYVTVPKPESFVDMFRFSTTNDFSVSSDEAKLALTEEMLAGITVDLFQKDLPNKTADYVYASAFYQDNPDFKIIDNGVFGLEQVGKKHTLNMSSLKEYMTEEYTFWFDMKVSSKCEKGFAGIGWVDGTHEIHLYNKEHSSNIANSDDRVDEEKAKRDYGWVDSVEWTQRDGIDDLDMYVRGDQCKEMMYLLYDAHGEDEDTWYLRWIEIDVKVMKK
ncbi:MAG: hypothetical protein E7668_04220 [Ruminococcaceae bacterium]|nr:hypothetical protein [Oscillospiraceae bacterium]